MGAAVAERMRSSSAYEEESRGCILAAAGAVVA